MMSFSKSGKRLHTDLKAARDSFISAESVTAMTSAVRRQSSEVSATSPKYEPSFRTATTFRPPPGRWMRTLNFPSATKYISCPMSPLTHTASSFTHSTRLSANAMARATSGLRFWNSGHFLISGSSESSASSASWMPCASRRFFWIWKKSSRVFG